MDPTVKPTAAPATAGPTALRAAGSALGLVRERFATGCDGQSAADAMAGVHTAGDQLHAPNCMRGSSAALPELCEFEGNDSQSDKSKSGAGA